MASAPFDWMEPKLPPGYAQTSAQRFNDSFKAEITERARLLRRLQRPKDQTVRRIEQNIAWEFENAPRPAFYKDIPKLVDGVYGK